MSQPTPLARRLRTLWARAVRHQPVLSKAAVALVGLVFVWGVWLTYDILSGLPGRDDIRSLGNMAQATTLYDMSDRPVFTIFKEQRIEVPVARISPHLLRAIVSIEDRRFFAHNGVDSFRVVGAAWKNLLQFRAAQGGSTITQQLARQSFLTSDKTLRRKLKEAVLAARIEDQYSKHEILELYLNKVYFGEGLYGVEAASLGYFGKPASDLDVPEAALLAGLVKSPSSYAPTVNLERATARRNVVLQAMLDEDVIDRPTWEQATHTRVKLQPKAGEPEASGLHFKEQVRLKLVELFGGERVYEGGLRVYTTIDPAMQEAAETEIARSLKEIEARQAAGKKRSRPSGAAHDDLLQAALVAVDPKTGEVRAMVGGRDKKASGFNRATQAQRQPGSAFKPFVYATALEAGYSPASLVDRLDEPIMTLEGAWIPEDGHSEGTAMTVRTALRTSSNRAAARMIENVGIERTAEYAKRLGLGSVPQVPSLALGSGEVTLLSMTMAYATFADGGMLHTPILIRRVVDAQGVTLFETAPSAERAISETTAFLMSHMLADVVNAGTASKARSDGFTLPAAGKTGTTNDYMDAWFVGFTPKLVSGVWIGFDQPRTILRNGYAGDLAVPLWARFMKSATRNDKPSWFKPPSGIVSMDVCRMSGKLPAGGCDDVAITNNDGTTVNRSVIQTEYFVKGTEPTESCDLHPGHSFLQAIAGVFRGTQNVTPVTAEAAGLPAATARADTPSAEAPVTPAASELPQSQTDKKKRGFWGRIFKGKD
ncbi:MAG: PBP1A family penicillin-binding protein [Acidobacteria bacterium]|nr:MAG: PBP1A family penicillin-binding protein [Acidobacteriota bacterium]